MMPLNQVRLLIAIAVCFTTNGYANYWGYNGIVQNQTYQIEFTPLIPQNTTYWATMSVSSIGGYGGIQQWLSSNPTTDHGGLFSIWDTTATNADSFVVGYPMTQIAAPYQVGWLDGYISDPTDQLSGSPIFHTFYPNIAIPRPSISKPKVTTNKAFSMTISGELGRQYRIQVSTNLVTWGDITNLISTSATWQFIDSLLTNYPQRFYRVASP
jgi:hypothetical protein